MRQKEGDVRAELARALEQIKKERGLDYANTLRPILIENLRRNRIQYFLDKQPGATVLDYVRRVVFRYDSLHRYMNQVRENQSTMVWVNLMKMLQEKAGECLCEMLTHSEKADLDNHISICADTSGVVLTKAYFPYDIEFERWLCVLVGHICRKHADHLRRNGSFRMVSLDDLDELIHNPDARALDDVEEYVSWRCDLETAVEQLPPRRRDVVWKYYYLGKSLSRIAEEEEVSPGVVYKRHHDACRQLRERLNSDG